MTNISQEIVPGTLTTEVVMRPFEMRSAADEAFHRAVGVTWLCLIALASMVSSGMAVLSLVMWNKSHQLFWLVVGTISSIIALLIALFILAVAITILIECIRCKGEKR